MNFLGMGTMEFLIIMLVAFIFLGPERMVDAARFMGKVVNQARRMTSELSQSMQAEIEPGSAIDPFDRSSGQKSSAALDKPQQRGPATSSGVDLGPDDASANEDAPVPFHPAGKAPPPETAEPNPDQDQARLDQARQDQG